MSPCWPGRWVCRARATTPGPTRGPSARARQDAELTEKIRRHHQASDEIYGAPRIHADLREIDGVRHRAQAGGPADARGRAGRGEPPQGHPHDDPRRTAAAAPTWCRREFHAAEPNRIWTADITYVPTWQGFLYLAVVLDVFSRRIVGWAMAEHMRTELVTDALAMAIHQRRPAGRGDPSQRQGQSIYLARVRPAL